MKIFILVIAFLVIWFLLFWVGGSRLDNGYDYIPAKRSWRWALFTFVCDILGFAFAYGMHIVLSNYHPL